ncbi:Rap1a/Tai family immunity protein [Microvirga terrestris]|uniref:Rap1a/Tai family immunity protein n=1 Tax=Microvirga terrestris TaxID=2791024 RepID=UPI003CCF9E42
MTSRLILLSALLCLCMPAASSAAKAEKRRWASQYLDACETSSAEWPICKAYIEGFLGATSTLVKNKKISPPFCLPEGISTEQIAAVFREFALQGPYRAVAMEGALLMSVGLKFPCQTS